MLSDETVKKLKDSAETRELLAFIREEYDKMDSVSDVGPTPSLPQVIAVEVRARQEAMKKLKAILDPFMDMGPDRPKFDPKEFVT